MAKPEKHRNPFPTVDAIIELDGDRVVLIRRKNPPHGWALPGGFVDRGEPLDRAAVREAREETGLDVELLEQFFTYSDPSRDPRHHTISTVYLARATGEPLGADDAAEAHAFHLAELPRELAFDHAEILRDWLTYRQTGERPGVPLRGQVGYTAARRSPPMPKNLSTLEKNILKSKGVTDAQLKKMAAAGIAGRADFATVGDSATLAELVGLKADVASRVMAWAAGAPTAGGGSGTVVVETADVVYCVHCKTKQPKDYKSGDLCPACGKQAEPVLACYWCGASGPGKHCRQCGARFVPTGELELAILLKRDGLPKDEIPAKLASLTAAEKDVLWGRVRKGRG